MSRIVPEIFLDRQTAITGIVSGDIRGIVVWTVARSVFDPVRGCVVYDTGEESIDVELEDQCLPVALLEGVGRSPQRLVVFSDHGLAGEGVCGVNVQRLGSVSQASCSMSTSSFKVLWFIS